MFTVKGHLRGCKIFVDTQPPRTITLKTGYLSDQEVVANVQEVDTDLYEVIKIIALTSGTRIDQSVIDEQRRCDAQSSHEDL